MRRHRQLVRALSLSTVAAVRLAGRLRAGPGRQPALRHRLRRGPAGCSRRPPSRRAGPPPIEAPKNDLSWRDCTSRVFGDAAVPPIPGVTLDCASYDADLDSDQRRHRNGQHRRGARPVGADPGRRRSAGDDHRIGPAVVGAAAGVAVARRRRRAQDASDRGGRPPRHRACRARWTAATCSTARRCSTRRSSSPATTPSPTSARSP